MSVAVKIYFCILLGYFIGCINPSYIFARARGFDIHKAGSHNPGGSNAIITMGKRIGVLCCILDILKAFLAVKLALKLFPDVSLAYPLTAAACILGHMFPFYMRFKGGKGLACLGGVIMAYSKTVFLVLLAIEILIVLITDYICIVPITASAAFTVVYGITEKNVTGVLIFIPIVIAVFLKHVENLRRIKQGTELHLSYMWHKEEERERIESNIQKIDYDELDSVWRDKDIKNM